MRPPRWWAHCTCTPGAGDRQAPEAFRTEPRLPLTQDHAALGNLFTRIEIPAGTGSMRLHTSAVIAASGQPDPLLPCPSPWCSAGAGRAASMWSPTK